MKILSLDVLNNRYYISSISGDMFGVTDLKEDKETLYSLNDIYKLMSDGVCIYGMYANGEYEIIPRMCAILLNTIEGSPVCLKYTGHENYRQVIYMGYFFDAGRCITMFMFFDGKHDNSMIAFSSKYILENSNAFDLSYDNNEIEVDKLVEMIEEVQ